MPTSIVPITIYGELHQGSSQVPICLRNWSAKPMVIPIKVVVDKVALANQWFSQWEPQESTHVPHKDWIPEELNLQGREEWLKEEQDQARKLLVKWEHLFACSELDLGKTSLLKHQISLTD